MNNLKLTIKNGGVLEINNVETKPVKDKHLETVENLKQHSERFNAPTPSEKEAWISKTVEVELLSPANVSVSSFQCQV